MGWPQTRPTSHLPPGLCSVRSVYPSPAPGTNANTRRLGRNLQAAGVAIFGARTPKFGDPGLRPVIDQHTLSGC
jgi:hypothetical protein